MLLALAGCRDLPTIEAGVCGNAVIEENEDCDTFIEKGENKGGYCRKPGEDAACHWDCTVAIDGKRSTCPTNWGCGNDGICHKLEGSYEATQISTDLSSWLTTADFDGDGRSDVISTEPADQVQQARFRLHYFNDASELVETRTFPRVTTRPVVYQRSPRRPADLIFSNFRVGMLRGRQDRQWVPATFSSYVVNNSGLRVVSLLDDLVDGQTVLATFTTFDRGLGVYVPRPDGSQLDFKASLSHPLDELVADPLAVDLFAGVDSPCKDVVYAYRGENIVHVLDLCRLGTEPMDPEITFRDQPREQLVHLPEGLGSESAPVVVDMEGDGDLDLLLGSGDSTYVAYNDGQTLADAVGPLELRMLDQKEPYRLPPPIAAGDLSGDDAADFVLPTGAVASHRSLVDGDVVYGRSYNNHEQPWTTAEVIDLNGNDLPDVVAASQGAPGITLLNGTGSFYQVAARLSTRGDVRLLTTGDFDGDLLHDVAFLEAGAREDLPDGLAIAFGTRDQLPLSSTRIAELSGAQQLGHARDVGLDSLFMAATEVVKGVQQSSLTLWDGSPDRLPFAPYTLVPFVKDKALNASSALNIVVGSFTRPGAGDVVALGIDRPTSTDYTLWLVPNITSGYEPPRLLDFQAVAGVQPTIPTGANAFRLRLAALATDLDRDGLDEVVGLMPANDTDCVLVSYDIDVQHSKATLHGSALYLGESCPTPELGAWDQDEDGRVDALVLLTGEGQSRHLSLLSHAADGFDAATLTRVAGAQDVRGFAIFPARAGKRLAFVTNAGLAYATSSHVEEELDEVHPLADFTDARSVVVVDVNLDGLDDVVVADAEGLWLVQAKLQ